MLIVSDKSGQMANRMFLFAHLIAFAFEHNLTVSNPTFDEYGAYYEGTRRDIFSRFPAQKSWLAPTAARRRYVYKVIDNLTRRRLKFRVPLPKFTATLCLDLMEFCEMTSPKFQNALQSHPLLFLRGWHFIDLALFEKHADQIRRFFQPVAPHAENVETLIQSCRADTDVLIGVHIRRGDYKNFMEGRYYFEHHVYATLMHRTKALFPERKVRFLICSNEPVPTEVFQGLDYRLGNNHLVEDMYSLARCDYLLGPASTYTMWASFYGQVPLYQVYEPEKDFARDAFTIKEGHF